MVGQGSSDGNGAERQGQQFRTEPVTDRRVSEVLRRKRGAIRQAPLPPGSPSWDDVLDLRLSEIERRANANEPGYRTIRKLLSDKRFDR